MRAIANRRALGPASNRCERVAAHTPDGSLADEPSRIDRQRVPPIRAGRKDVVQQRPDPAWPQARDRNRMADGGTVWNRASRWFRSRMRTPPSWLLATCLQVISAARLPYQSTWMLARLMSGLGPSCLDLTPRHVTPPASPGLRMRWQTADTSAESSCLLDFRASDSHPSSRVHFDTAPSGGPPGHMWSVRRRAQVGEQGWWVSSSHSVL